MVSDLLSLNIIFEVQQGSQLVPTKKDGGFVLESPLQKHYFLVMWKGFKEVLVIGCVLCRQFLRIVFGKEKIAAVICPGCVLCVTWMCNVLLLVTVTS